MCYSIATLLSVYKIISISGSSLICTPLNGQPVKGVNISYIGPFLYDVFEDGSLIYRFCEIYSYTVLNFLILYDTII